MISMICENRQEGGAAFVGGSIRLAATFGSRFMGLMFQRSLPEGSGLLLMPCGSIHMCFMRMKLDIVYMDAAFRVLGVHTGVKPWQLGRAVKGTRQVLELPAGTARLCGISEGCRLAVGPSALVSPLGTIEKRENHGFEIA